MDFQIVKHMEDGARAESKDLNSIRKDATIHKLSYESREGVLKKRGHVVKVRPKYFYCHNVVSMLSS